MIKELFDWSRYNARKLYMTYIRHHVELHGHGDDIEADHGGDPEVEILGGDQLVDHEAEGAKVNVVGSLHHS